MSSSSANSSATDSLGRALSLMELLLSHPRGLSHTDICRELALPSSTCTYITGKLVARGYLSRDKFGRFQLGLRTVSLAHGALHGLGFRSISEPVLYRITSETGLSAGIGVRQGTCVLLVDRVEGPDVVEKVMDGRKGKPSTRTRADRDVGRELPFHSTALGKVLLAYLPDAERDSLIDRLKMSALTQSTIRSKDALRMSLVEVRKHGYALAEEEHYSTVRALAVPIFNSAREVPAALSLNGPPTVSAWDDIAQLVGMVQSAATEISTQSRYAWQS